MTTWIEYLKALVYGVLEGITEWLPISSSGHLILLERILPLHLSAEFLSMFRVLIQFAAILAVILLFWPRIWPFPLERRAGKIRFGCEVKTLRLWLMILVACLPAAVVGVLIDEWAEKNFYHPLSVGIWLILVGLLFIVIEKRQAASGAKRLRMEDIGMREALLIGVCQLPAAVFPGVSRSGASILGGLCLGLSRELATEFSFFLAIPVMLGASFLKLLRLGRLPCLAELPVLAVASLVSFVVSIFSLRFLINYLRKHNFIPFAIYRIVLGLLVLLLLFL